MFGYRKYYYPRIIYAIVNNNTLRVYIGSSRKPLQRYSSHLSDLRSGTHSSKLMQLDYWAYGENYSLFELDVIEKEEDKAMEYEYMWLFKTHDVNYGYNQGDFVCINKYVLQSQDKKLIDDRNVSFKDLSIYMTHRPFEKILRNDMALNGIHRTSDIAETLDMSLGALVARFKHHWLFSKEEIKRAGKVCHWNNDKIEKFSEGLS